MTSPTRSQPYQDDLTALLTVMDTLDVFQDPDTRLQPEELARRVRRLYQAQDLPLEEDALNRAVALYADPTWTRPTPVAPAPVPAPPAPRPVLPVPVAEKPPVPHPDMDPEGAKIGAMCFGFLLVSGFLLASAMLRVPSAKIPISTPTAHPPTELAVHLVQQVQESPEDAQRWFQTREAEIQLATYQMKGVVTAMSGGGSRLTLAHADPRVLRSMDAPLHALSSPASPVRIVVDGQEVRDLAQISEPANTVYIERPTSPP